VAGCVEEYDVASGFRRDVIRADVLGNAAGFTLGDTCCTNRVEQRRLAVIDVTHDGDDRRACHRVLRLHILRFNFEHVLLERAELELGAELACDHRCGFGVDGAVDRHHQPLIEQLFQHVLHALIELVGEIFYRHAFHERDGARDRRRRDLCGLLRTRIAPLIPIRAPADWRTHRRRGKARCAWTLLTDAA
jgi:hypothetical protein